MWEHLQLQLFFTEIITNSWGKYLKSNSDFLNFWPQLLNVIYQGSKLNFSGDNFANGSASGIFTSYPNKDITNTWILAYDQALGKKHTFKI